MSQPDEAKLAQAWEQFDAAVRMEEKGKQPGKSENVQRMTVKSADKKLDEAVRLETEAWEEA